MLNVKGIIFLALLLGIATGIPVGYATLEEEDFPYLDALRAEELETSFFEMQDHSLFERQDIPFAKQQDIPFFEERGIPFVKEQGIPFVEDVVERGRVVEKRRAQGATTLSVWSYPIHLRSRLEGYVTHLSYHC